MASYRWPSAKLQYHQCVNNGDNAVSHEAIDIKYLRHCGLCLHLFRYLGSNIEQSHIASKTNCFWLVLVRWHNLIFNKDITFKIIVSNFAYIWYKLKWVYQYLPIFSYLEMLCTKQISSGGTSNYITQINIQNLSFAKMHLKTSSVELRSSCQG